MYSIGHCEDNRITFKQHNDIIIARDGLVW
jgi:hypothetical protein